MWQVVGEASIAEEIGARLRLSELYYALAACKNLERGEYALRGLFRSFGRADKGTVRLIFERIIIMPREVPALCVKGGS